jgi:phosphoribosylaminoimidazole (AIR) synthetase
VSPLFRLARELTPQMSTDELYRTLNMGIGMVVICAPGDLATLQDAIAEPTWVIGELARGTGRVHLT